MFTVYLILLQSLCLMVNLTHECVPTCLALLHCLLQPWVTFSKAQQKIQPRNLAIWQDGFGRCGYQSSLSLWDVLRVSSTVSESINKSWVAESQTGYVEAKKRRNRDLKCCYLLLFYHYIGEFIICKVMCQNTVYYQTFLPICVQNMYKTQIWA